MEKPGAGLRLWFADDVSPTVRARIGYAFRTFCAVYRVECSIGSESFAGVRLLRYGGPSRTQTGEAVLPALYIPRRPHESASPPRLGPERFPAFHSAAGQMDWLGEIFEWISCADEYAVRERDSVGRIPFEASVHGRYGLDPTVPYAAVAMREFARAIGVQPPTTTARIAASHDLDYIPTSKLGDVRRLAKNVAVAALHDKDLMLAIGIAGAALRGLGKRRSPLDYLSQMSNRERSLGFHSTSNVICRNTCARDANYTLDDARIVQHLRGLVREGGELGVHASYMSLRDGGLAEELATLRGFGLDVRGVRAHWLRYAGSDLFDAVEKAQFEYDSTVGFSERVGFRSGASFVYRPYNFSTEKAYPFFEVPLAIMDGALYSHARASKTPPEKLAERVLEMTRAFPSGGVSVLWHNTVFEGGQLPRRIGELYWRLPRSSDRWMTNVALVDDERVWFERAFREGVLC